MDLALWFPGNRRSVDPEDQRRRRIAVQTCKTCPVRMECLTHAVLTPERFGIWGGLDGIQRGNSRVCQRIRQQAMAPA